MYALLYFCHMRQIYHVKRQFCHTLPNYHVNPYNARKRFIRQTRKQ
jgi:hypothetical protein